jgi:hypothetical protein
VRERPDEAAVANGQGTGKIDKRGLQRRFDLQQHGRGQPEVSVGRMSLGLIEQLTDQVATLLGKAT